MIYENGVYKINNENYISNVYAPIMPIINFPLYYNEVFMCISKLILRGLDIDNFDYYVSNYGRVYSAKRNIILAQQLNKDGYMEITLTGKKCKGDYLVHRLVLGTFNPIPGMNSLQVNHMDGDDKNNNLSNLEWCTNEENKDHAMISGFMGKKLTNQDASRIRELNLQGMSYDDIRQFYPDVSKDGIRKVCKNVYHPEENYIPRDNRTILLSDDDVAEMRRMHTEGFSTEYINSQFPQVSPKTILEVCKNRSHVDDNYISVDNRVKLSDEAIVDIRNMRDNGYSYEAINMKYPSVSSKTLTAIANNKLRVDPNYSIGERLYEHPGRKKISDEDVANIRYLYNNCNKSCREIYYGYGNYKDYISLDLVRRVCKNTLHYDPNYTPRM